MITIDLFSRHQQHLPTIAEIWHEVLGKVWMPHVTIDYIEQLISSWTEIDDLPTAYIALNTNHLPVGIASLQKNCGIRPDLQPWLGSLVVATSHQQQGIGKTLINTVKEKASSMGYPTLYLFTFDPKLLTYYGRLGWKSIGSDKFMNQPVYVLEIDV